MAVGATMVRPVPAMVPDDQVPWPSKVKSESPLMVALPARVSAWVVRLSSSVIVPVKPFMIWMFANDWLAFSAMLSIEDVTLLLLKTRLSPAMGAVRDR